MGYYFEHLSEEDEKKITAALWAKYGHMSIREMNDDLFGIGFIPSVDPLPADYDGEKTNAHQVTSATKNFLLDDEAGHFNFNQPSHKWDIKPKTMSDAKSTVQEAEATALLNRLCNIEDIAAANRNRSKNIRESMFGLTPPHDQPVEGKENPESWFAIVNAKLDQIQDSLNETSNQLDRTFSGMQF